MSFRKGINDMLRDPHGNVSEAKTFAVLFKAVLLYTFLHNVDLILGSWEILSVVVTTFIAPDLLKKIISVKAGITTTKISSESSMIREEKG